MLSIELAPPFRQIASCSFRVSRPGRRAYTPSR
jgi:hypothetical protein